MTEYALTEQSALERMAQGDEAGLAWCIQTYTGYVSAIVWNILGQHLTVQDAEEVVADVFVSLWQYCQNPQPNKLKAYLGRIARSRAIDRLRREKFTLSLEYDEVEFSTDSSETQVLAQEQKEQLRQALRDMPPVYQEIFIRHYYYCQSAVAIAAAMGIKPDTVRQRLRRGRMFLRQTLTEGGMTL
jgi:RNA polymerase sigma-70 factor (ECF subfamily)